MKKQFLLFIFSILVFLSYGAECVMVPLSLSERVANATLIVEAKVQYKSAYWNSDKTMIYTANVLQISKVYKGAQLISGANISLISSGGRVGDKAIKVDPEIQLESGEIGIFLLTNTNGEWVSESGPQGFIRFDKHTAEASDIFNIYPAFSIQSTIESLTGLAVKDIQSAITRVSISVKRSTPVINSISPKTMTAGTSSVLTIKGSNFNSSMDTSSVQFKNADNGGLSYIKAMKWDYISWSDTMIKLKVRTKAGTGKIRLVINNNGIVISTDTLKIPYAHLNVESFDTIGYEDQLIGMNVNNGITWKLNKKFFDSTAARGAFTRSLERWRCGTYINWDTLGTINHSAIKSDGINVCAWDTNSNMPSGVLAQCFSYFSGCFNPGIQWFVSEIDIRFRIKPTSTTNWNYTTGNATANQFHFESVATHELGHGHQMGHVINSAVVMHYSIANGQTKPNLSTDDINGGNYVITKSASSICLKPVHTKLNSGNCALITPKANFTMTKNSICKLENILISDSSVGNISAYAWDFGTGASPATANTKGPHVVQYNSGGNKNISLTITTINGNLNKSKSLLVANDSKIITNFTYLAAENGKVSFTNTSNNPNSEKWYFGDGDSFSGSLPVHVYSTGGTYNIKLSSTNTCNTKDTIKSIKFAMLNFTSNISSACILQPITYMDSSDNNVAGWTWTFTGGSPSSANGKGPHKVVYSSPGSKSSSLQISVSGGQNQTYTRNNLVTIGTDTFTIADFIYGYYGKNIVGFDNKSNASNAKYTWYFGDGDSSSEKNPIHTYTNANNKNVRLIVKGDCFEDDTIIQLRDFTNLQSDQINGFKIYPNPNNGQFRILSDFSGEMRIEISDLNGKSILKLIKRSDEKITLENIQAGIYLVRIFTENGISYAVLNLVP